MGNRKKCLKIAEVMKNKVITLTKQTLATSSDGRFIFGSGKPHK